MDQKIKVDSDGNQIRQEKTIIARRKEKNCTTKQHQRGAARCHLIIRIWIKTSQTKQINRKSLTQKGT